MVTPRFGAALALAIGLGACDYGDNLTPTSIGGPAIDSTTIPKYEQPLLIPPVMPPTGAGSGGTEYRIAARQFRQQVLPPSMPMTTVWGYGRDDDPATFSYPGFTMETRSNFPVRVTWVNDLLDDNGRFLPPLLPVDSTIHWADPGGVESGDHDHSNDDDDNTQDGAFYTGPVPIVTHVHGAHSFDHSDGHPEAWFLPNADNIPGTFTSRGPTYQSQVEVGLGEAVFDYPNDQAAATLWYHDHTLGMTRVNVYAGLAGFWIIRDNDDDILNLPGPAPRLGDAEGTRYYEIPIVIQDKTFSDDGALWYPSSRSEYDGYTGPYTPESDVPPIWGPEFIGNAIVVNGRTWPFLEVEPRLYRFRFLNGSDARTLIMAFDRAGLEFVQIGGDGGRTFGAPVRHTQLTMGPAERYDVIVDFSSLAVGEVVTMLNLGPDDPWGGPNPVDGPQDPADPNSTGQIMQFRVVSLTGDGSPGAIPSTFAAAPVLTPTAPERDLLLRELAVEGDFPSHVLLGTVALGPLFWTDPTTEIIKVDDTEIWRVANTTDDAHPIHLHLVDFQVLDRIPFDADGLEAAQDAHAAGTGPAPVLDDFITGPAVPAQPGEASPKDTVMMLPGTITRIVATFDRVGSYVWHCHIIEHEDNEMMRPLQIVPR